MTSLQKQWQNFVSYTNFHKIRSRQARDLLGRFETWRGDSLYRGSQNLRFSNPNNMK